MAKATSDSLGNLHDLLATTLATAIKEGTPIYNDAGEKIGNAPAGAAILNVARQFLKDNNIDCAPEAANPIGLLKEAALPFADNVAPIRRSH